MKMLTFLEVGDLGGLVAMIVGLLAIGLFLGGIIVAAIIKVIYELNNKKNFTSSMFWRTVVLTMIIGGLASGMLCMGM